MPVYELIRGPYVLRRRIAFNDVLLDVASTTATIPIGTLPADAIGITGYANLVTDFVGALIPDLDIDVGTPASGGNVDAYIDALEAVGSSPENGVYASLTGDGSKQLVGAGKVVNALFTATGTTLDALTAGLVEVGVTFYRLGSPLSGS
jgi:hypothetical protein